MNDRNIHKVTGQMNQKTADPKANASVFLFFPTAHFLKTILTRPQMTQLVPPLRDLVFTDARAKV